MRESDQRTSDLSLGASVPPRKPKLMAQVREALRARHYSIRTEQAYCHWVKRLIYFHDVRHPAEMGEPEMNAFLTDLAVRDNVSASTQNQALSALLFLYRHVIGREVGELGEIVRARRPVRLPVVLSREEGLSSQACHVPHVPAFLRDTSSGRGLRYPDCPGTARSQRCENHNDLYACPEPRGQGGQESSRQSVEGSMRYAETIYHPPHLR